MDRKFWAVWRETGGSAPSKRHETFELAANEASRLAQQSGERYYVLEVIGVVAPVKFPTAYTAIRNGQEMDSATQQIRNPQPTW